MTNRWMCPVAKQNTTVGGWHGKTFEAKRPDGRVLPGIHHKQIARAVERQPGRLIQSCFFYARLCNVIRIGS